MIRRLLMKVLTDDSSVYHTLFTRNFDKYF